MKLGDLVLRWLTVLFLLVFVIAYLREAYAAGNRMNLWFGLTGALVLAWNVAAAIAAVNRRIAAASVPGD